MGARDGAERARRRRKKTSNDAPPPRTVARGSDDEDSEEDVSDEDVRFVRKNAAYASFMTSGSFEETPSGRRRRRDDDDDDAPEAAHGRAMRARAEAEAEEEARKANVPEERKPLALPVKRLDGTVVRDATAPADARLARNGASDWCGQVGTDYGIRRRTTTLVSLARHAHSCRLNLAAQTALFRCFSQVGPSDQNGLKLLLLPGDSQVVQSWLCCAVQTV